MNPGRRLTLPVTAALRRGAALAVALAAALAVLAGCGPGVGGTGTGGLTFYGATASTLCTSELAATLLCARGDGSPSAIGAPATVEEGTALVHFADHEQRATVQATLQANTIELAVPCRRLRFRGDWGVAGDADLRFFGSYGDATTAGEVPASLQVQAVAGEGTARVSVTLRDSDGRIVVGPVLLQRVVQPAAAAPC